MSRRVLLTLVAATLAAVGVMLLLVGEQPHLVRRALPAALAVGLLAGTRTWRSVGAG